MPVRRTKLLAAAVALASAAAAAPAADAATLTGVDLSHYVRTGRYDLPHPSRDPAPTGSLLAQEASSVTYDPDTGTLFVVGDGGTSVVQVDKTGRLIDSMTLGRDAGGSPLFADTEGIAYVGGGRFVITEERVRQANLFTYSGGGTLTRAGAQTVKLGTTIGNIGIEGITHDPVSGDYIAVKEMSPEGIFETAIDWAAGTATNGGPLVENSANLFDPALIGTDDLSDVYALDNVATLTGPARDDLLIISQASGRIVEVTRTGVVNSTLAIQGDADNPLSVPDQTHEGVTMDGDGNIYTVNEQGGGDVNHPQLWVYSPTSASNAAPTAVTLNNKVASLPENANTSSRVKVADVAVSDDGLGANALSVTGPDAASFEVDQTGLYLKAGTALDYETKSSYKVSVAVDDPSVGSSPDAVSDQYTLNITDVDEGPTTPPSLAVTEVSPWSSGDSTYAADWWEVTNTGTEAVDLTGFKMDDDSDSFSRAVALNGVSTLLPGQSAVFTEGTAATASALTSYWFGTDVPAGLKVGYYSGSGVGLSTGGDQVNLFDRAGNQVAGVRFGTATSGRTFDNAAGDATVTRLSAAGVDGARTVGTETGSPGTIQQAPVITEVSPWSSGDSSYAADWWEITNTSSRTINLAGWKMDDNSNSWTNAVALHGVDTLKPGESAVFLEGDATTGAAFIRYWFGDTPPSGLKVGYYSGSGVGLSTGGDSVQLFDAFGNRTTGIAFGASTSGQTFDNSAGAGSPNLPLPTVSTLSVAGRNGARTVGRETGSPLTITPDTTAPVVTWSGNAGTYTVADTIAITCAATDEQYGSGLASSTCANIGPTDAASLGLGSHTVTATATDHAGNTGTASATYTVIATAGSICTLTQRYADGSAAFGRMNRLQKAVSDALVSGSCQLLLNGITTRTPALIKKLEVSLYTALVNGYAKSGWLTTAQARQLAGFAAAL
jgi:uncharacterized protein YjiK